jgi:hypothetical protein
MDHTLLHIACLPFDRDHIQTSSPKALPSIQDIRSVSPVSKRALRWTSTYNGSGEETWFEPAMAYENEKHQRRLANSKNYPFSPWQWSRKPQQGHAKQEAVCEFVITSYKHGPKVSDRNKHGNDMLHYLTAARCPNMSLIAWAQQVDGVRAWKIGKNFCSFSARDLYEEGNRSRSLGRDAKNLGFLYPHEREIVLKG